MKKGFTLVELLVVIAIIAILSVVGVTVFTGIQKKALDAKVKGDVTAFTTAYELKYNLATGNYPSSLDNSDFVGGIPLKPDKNPYAGYGGLSCTSSSCNLLGTGNTDKPFQICAILNTGERYCKDSVRISDRGGTVTRTNVLIADLSTPTPTPTPPSSPSPSPTPSAFVCTACAADINGDGRVSSSDISIVTTCFNKPASQCSNPRADINGDGTANQPDSDCARSQFGQRCGAPTSTPTSAPTPAPTPTPSQASCADGTNDQVYSSSMVGCNGAVNWTNKGTLCAAGSHVCSFAEYNARGGQTTQPTQTRWLSDTSSFAGYARTCSSTFCGGTYCYEYPPGSNTGLLAQGSALRSYSSSCAISAGTVGYIGAGALPSIYTSGYNAQGTTCCN